MDMRVQRTRKSIVNAFIELRAKKPLEKITVRELSELAFINKATFYQHYRDIYDLSEQLESEAIENVLASMPHPEWLISDPSVGFRELTEVIISQSGLFSILFSDSRRTNLINKLEQGLRNLIYEKYPAYKNDLAKNVMMTFLIQGSFNAFTRHSYEDREEVIEILGRINECLINSFEDGV